MDFCPVPLAWLNALATDEMLAAANLTRAEFLTFMTFNFTQGEEDADNPSKI